MTQVEALTILKTGANVYLTGEPGSGKTHTINEYVTYLRDHDIEPAITASTGIAATHIGGMTIHSWSGLGIRSELTHYELDKLASTEYIAKRILRTKVLIIDEISMLRADMLTMIDRIAQEVKGNSFPFGGLQLVLVGDFFQLPPIVKEKSLIKKDITKYVASEYTYEYTDENTSENRTDFVYESPSWENLKPIICYLTEQHRQDDENYLELLSAIRGNIFNESHANELETRRILPEAVSGTMTKLFSHNADVDKVNTDMLSRIDQESRIFGMTSQGRAPLVETLKKGCLSPETLTLKIGAKVMCTKNNPKAGYVNGTLGTIIRFESGTNYPVIETISGKEITIEPASWSIEENGKIRAEISQIPLRLAWAITVHKSQGMSLDEAVMDLSQVFEYGQGYVALSRVRRLSGLHLLGWNRETFKVHPEILKIDQKFREQSKSAEIAFNKIKEETLKDMHQNFIKASGGVLHPKNSKLKQSKVQKNGQYTRDLTLELWKSGKSLEDIAGDRNLKIETILSHIEDLVKKKRVSRDELGKLLSPSLIESLSEIHSAFRILKTDKLTPVFEYFKGEYPYTDLRIARILLDE